MVSNSRDGLILPPGPAGRCDDYRVGGPVVEKDPKTGRWLLWYYCRDHAFNPASPAPLGSGRIALALSDDGIHWTRHDGALAGGAIMEPSPNREDFDSLHIGLTDMTRVGDAWWMWYFGGDYALRKTGGAIAEMVGLGMRPGLAVSHDGFGFTRRRGLATGGALVDIPGDAVYASWPNGFFDGERFILQYSVPPFSYDRYDIKVAISPDGTHWQDAGELRWADAARAYDGNGPLTRHVSANPLPGGRKFLMVYTALDEAPKQGRTIAAADSDDGLVWHRLYDRPILAPAGGDAWDSYGIANPRLVADGGKLHLYYYGFESLTAPSGARGIGLAISETGDLRDLRRVRTE